MPSINKPSRRRFDSDVPAAFRAAFDFRQVPADAWRRYQSGDEAAFGELVAHYLPLVAIVVAVAKRRRPELYCEAFADLLNDGAIGLMNAIRNWEKQRHSFWSAQARREIRRSLLREVIARRFGLSHRQSANRSMIARFRSRFVQEQGTLPNREELRAHLAEHFTNPNLVIESSRAIVPTPPARARRLAGNEVSTEPTPESVAIDAETRRLMLKGLSGDDAEMLKMILRGEGPREIAAAFGIHWGTAYKRMRGLLWEARARADLAAYADADPVPVPVSRAGIYHSAARIPGRGGVNLPPQVLAMSLRTLPTRKLLERADRTDAEIVKLLRSGYSQRALRDATRGKTCDVRKRISALQQSLLAELKVRPLAG